jgi:hypothetical protein
MYRAGYVRDATSPSPSPHLSSTEGCDQLTYIHPILIVIDTNSEKKMWLRGGLSKKEHMKKKRRQKKEVKRKRPTKVLAHDKKKGAPEERRGQFRRLT